MATLLTTKSLGAGVCFTVALALMSAPALAHSCEEEIPRVEASIQEMPGDAFKDTAEFQLNKAKERLASGNEEACLKYVESARTAVEAEQMSNQD
jgi:hypothetical protein